MRKQSTVSIFRVPDRPGKTLAKGQGQRRKGKKTSITKKTKTLERVPLIKPARAYVGLQENYPSYSLVLHHKGKEHVIKVDYKVWYDLGQAGVGAI